MLVDQEGFGKAIAIFIVDNKIICLDCYCTITIWNLNDLKLFKKFKKSNYRITILNTSCSIDAESKKMAAFTLDGDLVVYDYTKHLRKKYIYNLLNIEN